MDGCVPRGDVDEIGDETAGRAGLLPCAETIERAMIRDDCLRTAARDAGGGFPSGRSTQNLAFLIDDGSDADGRNPALPAVSFPISLMLSGATRPVRLVETKVLRVSTKVQKQTNLKIRGSKVIP
jgi:hypothetical protein